ncbi:ABC transporter substrate-binding protein [Actinocrispum wychmicini]|uniref:Peptide/nickel transport system substrate-binding protein n=1 Tax=Actinocrispum wychmicini TaxID=1213861 RepID=A0A4R2JR17_9PSEU|nr:ABC transporter substrate-binding protein [Actinocrispum wychmicini]TCO59648.1 peptide/nickel transport system substrate-binding protein [Actinocrispum wychmicini]
MNQPRCGGRLRLRGDQELPEPVAAHRHPMAAVTRLCARQLFTYRGDAVPGSWQAVAPVPDLAVAVPSIYNAGVGASYTSYVIHLRPDVYWDTDPVRAVTAHDVVRGVKRMCTPFCRPTALPYFTSTIRGLAEYLAGHPATPADLAEYANSHEISGVFALDDQTLVVELLRPALDLVDILAQPCASPVPAEYDAFLPDSAEARRNQRSTGPYRPVIRTGALVLEHNPAWRAESDPIRKRYVDSITVSRDGDVDLELLPSTRATGHPGLGLDPYLALNTRGPGPLRAKKTRRAVANAINRDARTIVPPGNDGHQQPPAPADPAPLTEAGITLTVVHPPSGAAAAQAIAADLAKIDITVHFRPLADDVYARVLTDRAMAEAGEWDVLVGAWYPDWSHGNGRAFLLPLCHSGSVTNPGGHTDPRVDDLIDEAMASPDEPGRAGIALREAERRVLADAAVVPVSFRPPRVPAPRHDGVHGVGVLSALGGLVDLSAVWLSPTPERESLEVRT